MSEDQMDADIKNMGKVIEYQEWVDDISKELKFKCQRTVNLSSL